MIERKPSLGALDSWSDAIRRIHRGRSLGLTQRHRGTETTSSLCLCASV
ncbi:MAG: hypothetical protein AVDCRST_MAG68-4304 [uncultured Gemmatimonadetes bacterium]|uniref:Uncharacterized protein n=1 Tax=uncultured Gemmatimonadota bacterium TaxID=203437 RepID=A0A6J4MHH6_9BACT|nr:MAG: hypothetical protein AVDCRST_MAG68-4304 [uncultured Gemmatimonadota bacterium]